MKLLLVFEVSDLLFMNWALRGLSSFSFSEHPLFFRREIDLSNRINLFKNSTENFMRQLIPQDSFNA